MNEALPLKRRLQAELDKLTPDQLDLARRFVEQVLCFHDPEVVQTFLKWRGDPVLGSILQLTADLDGEDRDQILFHAEDLYKDARTRVL